FYGQLLRGQSDISLSVGPHSSLARGLAQPRHDFGGALTGREDGIEDFPITPSSMISTMRLSSVMPATTKVGRSSARANFSSAWDRSGKGRWSRSAASR